MPKIPTWQQLVTRHKGDLKAASLAYRGVSSKTVSSKPKRTSKRRPVKMTRYRGGPVPENLEAFPIAMNIIHMYQQTKQANYMAESLLKISINKLPEKYKTKSLMTTAQRAADGSLNPAWFDMVPDWIYIYNMQYNEAIGHDWKPNS